MDEREFIKTADRKVLLSPTLAKGTNCKEWAGEKFLIFRALKPRPSTCKSSVICTQLGGLQIHVYQIMNVIPK
jgi:hypothetical protein